LAGGAGALVAVGDDRGLADTLARLLDDAEEARAIGERGRERIRREHAFERMIKEFVDVYDEVEQSCVLPGRRARFAGAS
jgi:glycosyltransferase involved in cell wall biosynthesis